MSRTIQTKICGLSTPETVAAAIEAGAAYVGFVFFPKSPRHVSRATARQLAMSVRGAAKTVALTVNATDREIEALLETVPLDMLQLHGRETPERVEEVKSRTGIPVMKAVGIGSEKDLESLAAFEAVADQVLVDAKPSPGADLPGGNGLSFDWKLIADRTWSTPWMLAGGLTPANVATAIALTGADQVDVSSGVETAPGVKDVRKIREFLRNARP